MNNQLIIISNETFFKNEAILINALFEAGLEVFHLRKPNASKDELMELLNEIKPKYRNRITLHPIAIGSHHEIAEEFGINRLHFKEENRPNFKRKEGFIYSTSFHDVETAEKEGEAFDYYFLSPIFDSISKEGYQGTQMISPSSKAVALGGISLENLEKVKELGYESIAVLGTIWENPENAMERFIRIKNKLERLKANSQQLTANSQKLTAKILTIAGFDPSGGAGILRDAAVISDFNMECLGVLTCNTIQNERTFESVHWLSQTEIEAQIEILKDEDVAVVKIGLTKDLQMIHFILDKVNANFPKAKIILDPILRTSSGFSMEHDSKQWREIVKRVDVLTPNWTEMETISGKKDIEETAREWSKQTIICLKGGHSPHPELDLLFVDGKRKEIIGRKEKLVSRHGSGCTYSTAFACAMANGWEFEEVAKVAKNKTEKYLIEGYDE